MVSDQELLEVANKEAAPAAEQENDQPPAAMDVDRKEPTPPADAQEGTDAKQSAVAHQPQPQPPPEQQHRQAEAEDEERPLTQRLRTRVPKEKKADKGKKKNEVTPNVTTIATEQAPPPPAIDVADVVSKLFPLYRKGDKSRCAPFAAGAKGDNLSRRA